MPSEATSHGRLKSPWASTMSRPYALHGTMPPERNAETRSGIAPEMATKDLQNGRDRGGALGVEERLDVTWRKHVAAVVRPADASSTVRIPAAACCSSHSRVYRSKVPVSFASSEAVIEPERSSAR